MFEALWAAVKDTKYLVLILDEIDAIFQDRRYNPSDFLQDLEMHGLIGSKVESAGRHGRRKFIWTQADLLEVRGAAFGYLQKHYRPDQILRVYRPPTGDIKPRTLTQIANELDRLR